MDRPGEGQTFVVSVNQVFGAVLGAKAASRTLVRINITGLYFDFGDKLTGLSFQGEKIGVA